jgi:putative hemolysin
MILGFEIIVVLMLILLNGLFSMSELALVSARRARLTVLIRHGVAGAAVARDLAEDPQRFLPTVQIGITLVSVLTGVFGGARLALQLEIWLHQFPQLGRFAEPLSIAVVVVLTTYLTLVLGELVPKHLALRHPETLAARVARPIARMAAISLPLVWLLGKSTNLVLRVFALNRAPQKDVTEEELKALLAEGTQSGELEHEERDMIERVLRLADKPVRAIMTPRTHLAWIDRSDTPKEIIDTLKAASYSRFVVCDGSIDNVVGVVHAKDILDRILDGAELSVAAALRQPLVIPDTVTALDALERLKSDPLGIALVMDEYGSFEGVVTAADVLEAIVGDPTDSEKQPGTGPDPADTILLMDGMMPVDELKSRLHLPELPAQGSYHTLGGLLLALLRRVPRAGDRIVFAGWRFEVVEMEGRRVDKVRVSHEPLAES